MSIFKVAWDKLKAGYIHDKIWFRNLPKTQREQIYMSLFFSGFGLIFLFLVIHLSTYVTETWHRLSTITTGVAFCGFLFVFALLHYVWYLEKRIKSLEEQIHGLQTSRS